MGSAAELVVGAQELALDGAGGGLLAVGDLGVAEADGLQREVVALAACERLEALAGVEAVGDLVGQLGAGRCGLGQLARLAGVREKTAGGLLALAGRAVPGCHRHAPQPREPLPVQGDRALARSVAVRLELKLPVG